MIIRLMQASNCSEENDRQESPYPYTYIHTTHMHTCMNTHVYTPTHPHAWKHTTYTHIHATYASHTCIHATHTQHTSSYMYTHHRHTHTPIHMYIPHTRTPIHTCTHVHTHTPYMHSYKQRYNFSQTYSII